MIRCRSFVKNSWVEGEGEGKKLYNPTTGAAIGETTTAGIDFGDVFAYARDVGGPNLRKMSFAERKDMIKALSMAIHEARNELIDVSIESGGTTRGDAKFDIDGASGTLAVYASVAKKLGDKKYLLDGEGEPLLRAKRFSGYHLQLPRRGVAVHINAFNFPAWGMCEKLAVSLLAGVPAITKPATSTSILAYRVFEKLVETGAMPEGAVQFVCGSTGNLLELLGPQDFLAFTGSAKVGNQLRSMPNIVNNSVRTNVEADSLNSVILGSDVEPGSELYGRFINDVIKEMSQKAGQKCTATRRIFLPESAVERVTEDLKERIDDLKVGDPALKEVDVGPLATKGQQDDAKAGVKTLLDAGAKVVAGDPENCEPVGADAAKGYFFPPVLLLAEDPRAAKSVHEHEVFGPVSTMMPYSDLNDVGELVALGGGSLVTTCYTDDKNFTEGVINEVAPYVGRLLLTNSKVMDQAVTPGTVLANCIHGGPGRAGGGEELGGIRGLSFYMQRTAIQGDRALLDRLFEVGQKAEA
jgi:oxepin-CoA hydrolase/3-oxo-5,6-dehydrosuberyl-CoA semialdehyde dehydrogenase